MAGARPPAPGLNIRPGSCYAPEPGTDVPGSGPLAPEDTIRAGDYHRALAGAGLSAPALGLLGISGQCLTSCA